MIQFESVTKTYPDGTTAVRNFSLTVPSHRTVALVGSSGSGKTTLLRMVNRMVDPSSGRVLIDDEDVLDRDPVALRRSIGYVLQSGGLLPHRTVLDNVATVPILTGRRRAQAHAQAKELLERVGLDPSLGSRYPAQLSGGQQQRVGVARALALDPNILLMDEPFGAVDPIVRGELQDELVRLQAELGKTILFVTHDIEEAFRLGDEVVVLKQGGEIAQRGTPAEILASPADDFVRDFVGLGRADLQLEVRQVGGRTVIVDPDGRPLGFLDKTPDDDGDARRVSGGGAQASAGAGRADGEAMRAGNDAGGSSGGGAQAGETRASGTQASVAHQGNAQSSNARPGGAQSRTAEPGAAQSGAHPSAAQASAAEASAAEANDPHLNAAHPSTTRAEPQT